MLHKFSGLARWSLVIVIIMVAGLLMLGASRGDSAITDELAHIPAGYTYVRYLDYRLNPEHPPLVKVLAGLPLLFKNLKFPAETPEWQTGVNEQWSLGGKFLYESGNDADEIIYWARIGPILLTLILVILIYLFAKEIVGRWWAILPAFLFAFSPTVLAHGHYVTTDIGATLGTFLALWSFLKFLNRPSQPLLVWTGLSFGIAQLLKFSNVLLIPYFLILTVIFYLSGILRNDVEKPPFRRYLGSLTMIFLIGFAAVYAVYFIFTLNYPLDKQQTDTRALLQTINPRWLAGTVTELSGFPIIRPAAQYFLGLLMVSQRAVGGNTAYFLGEVSNQAWWYYFPVVFLMKEPLPSLFIIFLGLLSGALVFSRGVWAVVFKRARVLSEYLMLHFPELAMILFIIIYWGTSIGGNLNIGIRHILPTVPFIYILATGALKKWFNLEDALSYRNQIVKILVFTHELLGLSVKVLILTGLLVWYLLSSLIVYPHFLSYFNIVSGGTGNGYKRVADSNYDWGQDLKRLAMYIEQVNNDDDYANDIKKIAVDYFGGGNLRYYLGETAEGWWSSRGNPKEEAGIEWLAVSINTIQGAKGKLVHGERKPEDEYDWLIEPYKPFNKVGKSIFIYKL